jgi:hypothetical protein
MIASKVAETETSDLSAVAHEALCSQRWEIAAELLDALLARDDDYVGVPFMGRYAGAPDFIGARIVAVNEAVRRNNDRDLLRVELEIEQQEASKSERNE